MLRIDMPRELESELALLAALTGKSVQFHVRQAMLEYLDDLDGRVAVEQWLEEVMTSGNGGAEPRAPLGNDELGA